MTLGLATSKFGKMAAISLLKVHSEGQGKKGFKRPVLFPKIVFLYDKDLHGDGSEKYSSADVFNAGIDCSSKTMYPDWLSLTGDGYVASMYKNIKKLLVLWVVLMVKKLLHINLIINYLLNLSKECGIDYLIRLNLKNKLKISLICLWI